MNDDPTLGELFEKAGDLADGQPNPHDENDAATLARYLKAQAACLRHAVAQEPVPQELMVSARRLLAAGERGPRPAWLGYGGWVAAALLLCLSLWQGVTLRQARREQVVMAEFVRDAQKFAGRPDLMELTTHDMAAARRWLTPALGARVRFAKGARGQLKGVRTCGLMGQRVGLLLFDVKGRAYALYVAKGRHLPLPQGQGQHWGVKSWREGDLTLLAIEMKDAHATQG